MYTNHPDDLALRRVVTLRQAAEMSSLSEDTLRRRYAELIIKLSPRRSGMRLSDVLSLGQSKSTA
jgi:hypothetical protein